jgi:thiol-disulfide isomerase/thioredoxin
MTEGTRRHRWALIPIGVAIAVTLSACSGPPGTGANAAGLPASPTALPQFTVAQFHDLLTSLHGSPVVVNIWASWCGPCIREAPGLAQTARQYRGKAQFVGVDIIDQRAPATAFIKRFGWTYPSVFDPTGAIRDDLGFLGQPVTVVFDAAGKRVDTIVGPAPASELQAQLAKLTSA